MHTDKTYQMLIQKMHEVSTLPQQTMGPLTPLYRVVIPYAKEAPWRWFVLGSLVTGIFFYVVSGALIVKLVSTLQHGF